MCQKVLSLDEKTKQNRLKAPTWQPFSGKTAVIIEKDKHLSIFYCKNKCTYKFYVLTIKSAFGNTLESS